MRRRAREAFVAELAAVPVFAVLDGDDVQELAATATRAREPAGMRFSQEGERGDELVVILEGRVEVRHGDDVVAALGVGDLFGEMALLTPTARRNATVVAVTPVVVAYLSRHHVEHLLEQSSDFAAAVQAIVDARAPRGPDAAPRSGPAQDPDGDAASAASQPE
jgi:CRP-like cAMP-binding protein